MTSKKSATRSFKTGTESIPTSGSNLRGERRVLQGYDSKMLTRREALHAATMGLAMVPISAILSGCETMNTMTQMGAQIGAASGLISSSQADSLQKVATATTRSFEDFTPEQEYYIGRTVGAVILQKYRPYSNQAANHYINLLGQSLSKASDRPETYGGYHFLIQDSSEINALAAPGGFIFVTRGLLKCCRNEDALAGVLAHEVAHVQEKHGIQAIEKSRITSALTTIGIEGAKSFGSSDLANLTSIFEGSITDITATLINSGYSKSFEKSADLSAVTILERVGYNPNGLVDMLAVMKQSLVPGRNDFGQTHPTPQERIALLEKRVGSFRKVESPIARQKRFDKVRITF